MRGTTLSALLAGLLLVVGACTSDDDATTADDTTTTADVDRTASERVADAAASTLDEGSAVVAMTISGPTGTEEIADEATDEGTTGGRDEAELTIDDDFDRDRRAFRSGPRAAVAADEALIIVDGSDAYIQQSMGAASGEEGEGTWLRFDLDEAAEEEDLRIEGLPDGFPFRESRQVLEVLRDGDHEATEVSTTTDDTTTTTDDDTAADDDTTTTADDDDADDTTTTTDDDADDTTTTTGGDAAGDDDTTTTTVGDDDTTTTTDGAATTGTAGERYEVVFDLDDDTFEGDSDRFLEGIAERTGMSELAVTVTIGSDDVITEVSYALDLDTATTTDDDADDTTTTTDDDTTTTTDDDADDTTTTTDDDTTGTTRTTVDTVEVTITYDDLGSGVDVEIPDDAQVTDLDADELREAFAGAGTRDRTGAGDTGDGAEDISPTTTSDDTTTTSTTAGG